MIARDRKLLAQLGTINARTGDFAPALMDAHPSQAGQRHLYWMFSTIPTAHE